MNGLYVDAAIADTDKININISQIFTIKRKILFSCFTNKILENKGVAQRIAKMKVITSTASI